MRKGIIASFIANLMIEVKVEHAAEALGCTLRNYTDLALLSRLEDILATAENDGDQISGPLSALMDQLTREQPVLLVFDLGNDKIPWREWLPLLKSSPATRRMPVVCFGPHVEADALREARSRGAEAVYPRSRFLRELGTILQQHMRQDDTAALEAACQGALSAVALRGLEKFNHRDYFEAHELLEEAWNEESGPGKELYRAILQVAVAYLQIERGNYNGAIKMFWRLRQWINPLPEICRGVDIAQLRQEAEDVYQALVSAGPEKIRQFDQRLFHPIVYHQ